MQQQTLGQISLILTSYSFKEHDQDVLFWAHQDSVSQMSFEAVKLNAMYLI